MLRFGKAPQADTATRDLPLNAPEWLAWLKARIVLSVGFNNAKSNVLR
jgi:hypothetical protein